MHEVTKKKRHRPLRVLFGQVPELIQALKPCFLMSPLSVSTYLTNGNFSFDLVVFDEASQIPPQDAICSILRAKQVIVAGDNQQLPPTNFFQVEQDDDEDSYAENDTALESILDQCAATPFFDRANLLWHYRSRHESLIAYSNREFYEGKLITFPSLDQRSAVDFHYVPNGSYDRGASRTNRLEAMHVVKLIIEHLDRFGTSKSLGIVALSTAQRDAIDKAIDDFIRIPRQLPLGSETQVMLARPDLAPLIPEKNSGLFFLKNLENVQGDECDHVILSVGYGPDRKSGASSVPLNFGPINRSGGERRLNVAITRAKWRTSVVCSFLPEELDLARLTTKNVGIVKLQSFLQYAQNGTFTAPTQGTGVTESDFEESVKMALDGRGLQTHSQVGCSGFRIDLAINHPDNDGRYILGIECDGAQYHSSKTARDRDRLRQEVLEDQGWKILRIWSFDWLRGRDREIERVLKKVEELRASQEIGVPANNPLFKEKDPGQPEEQAADAHGVGETISIKLEEYVKYRTRKIKDTDELRQVRNRTWACDEVIEEIGKIAKVEGPIHKQVLSHRIATSYGIKRLSTETQKDINYAIAEARAEKAIRVEGDFVWPTAGAKARPRARHGIEPIDHICLEEIGEAMLLLLGLHVGMTRDSLATETARLFGYQRNGELVATRMNCAIDKMLSNKVIQEHSGQVTLLNP